MPLVLTTQRADWQQRQPCRAGRERALSSGAEGGRRAGVAQPVGQVCAGIPEPVPAAPGLGRLASLRAPDRVPAPPPRAPAWES